MWQSSESVMLPLYEVHYQTRTDKPKWSQSVFSTDSFKRAQEIYTLYKGKEQALPKSYRMVKLYERIK